MEEKNFGRIGEKFQQSLVKVIIEDKKFSEIIIDVLEPSYFDNAYFKYIVQNIKECYEKYNKIPDYVTLEQKIMSEGPENTTTRAHMDTLQDIKNHELKDPGYVKDVSMNFCKQQVLKRELKIVNKIIENGKFEDYHKIEEIIRKALQVGASTDDLRDVFFNIESVLDKDSRVPIPTGIHGIDNLLNGGLGIGEFGVVIAPLGVGKTSMLTLFANTAFNEGRNVLQIFFEDNMNNILRKHFTIWTGISADDQPDRKDEVIPMVEEARAASKGNLDLLKYPSGSITVSQIRTKLRKLAAEGKKVDLLLIDYIECIIPERSDFDEQWKGEGLIMRQLDAMTSEFNMAIWAAVQGNRQSISSEVVTSDQIGGSIQKAQIGHVVISVGKTLEQKEHNFATMTLLKSRIGKDGIVFQNCTFNNEYLHIDTESQNTLLGHKEEVAEKKRNRSSDVYKERLERELNLKNKTQENN